MSVSLILQKLKCQISDLTGYDKKRLFYTQGDYGLWQCVKPCHNQTYDNGETVRKMAAQQREMRVPSELVPRCPVCGRPMTMNLRCDDTFVEDAGWHAARQRYQDFLRRHKGLRVVFLELGVGGNTPVIIKYPFWRMTRENRNAAYVCINQQESCLPGEIAGQSICIRQDIGTVVHALSSDWTDRAERDVRGQFFYSGGAVPPGQRRKAVTPSG